MSLRVLLVGGPMYEALYSRIEAFAQEHALPVQVTLSRDHPDLNARIEAAFSSGGAPFDLISTHTKYVPSQRAWLSKLPEALVDGFAPRVVELARVDGALYSVPRNLDVKLLHYRRDLLARVPDSWEGLLEAATALNDPPRRAGFAFPGKESGLFGHFFELQAMAGGALFRPVDGRLEPRLNDDAGHWALDLLVRLYRHAAPRETPDWHYDDVAACFQSGRAALTSDWPGGFAQHRLSSIGANLEVALYPAGAAGRFVYAGSHSFAVPHGTQHRDAALALLARLTDAESQRLEANLGSVPTRTAVLEQIQADAPAGSLEARRWTLLQAAMQCALIPPKFAAYAKVEDAIWRGLRRALTGEHSVPEALRATEATVKAVMQA